MITIISVVAFFVIAYIFYDMITTRKNIKKFKITKEIKKNYKKLTVSTNEVVILTRDYYAEESPDQLAGAETLYSLYVDSMPQVEQKYISILTYDFFINSTKYTFKSVPIDMSNTQIKDIFKNEKNIAIYYDESDLTKHYFDLSKLIRE